ncbi:hypothetical protein P3T27_005846 [Kitasatospora sp. MAA19]|uniref:SMI1/KNR4 family protein n=1 Tax=unclassified Kitasatospora TaxID=2633591 RepID=UPI0024734630|nr:SMI1/KNR4 family protein [Kitasatospora sp. MAA19]MDH6709100.1 hypothetical protein [Kitasatospora sp. MAA19]
MTEDEVFESIRVYAANAGLVPASPEAVAEAERVIGHSLPPLLRRLYLEVANGGFGPRRSVLGVSGAPWMGGNATDLVDGYEGFKSDPDRVHPAGVVPLFELGCAIWWLVDCRDPAGPMWGWDPHGCCLGHALSPQGLTLAEWLAESIDGRDPRPVTDVEPPAGPCS